MCILSGPRKISNNHNCILPWSRWRLHHLRRHCTYSSKSYTHSWKLQKKSDLCSITCTLQFTFRLAKKGCNDIPECEELAAESGAQCTSGHWQTARGQQDWHDHRENCTDGERQGAGPATGPAILWDLCPEWHKCGRDVHVHSHTDQETSCGQHQGGTEEEVWWLCFFFSASGRGRAQQALLFQLLRFNIIYILFVSWQSLN